MPRAPSISVTELADLMVKYKGDYDAVAEATGRKASYIRLRVRKNHQLKALWVENAVD